MSRRKGLHLTPRDDRCLGELGEVLVASTAMIHRRHFPEDTTGKSCLRRLSQLAAHGLTKPVTITACFGPRSARHEVHRLTSTGAEVVGYRSGTPPPRLLRTEPTAQTLLHRLSVARTLLAVNDAAAAAAFPKPQWLLEHDRLPAAPRDVPEPQQYLLADDFLPLPAAEGRPAEHYGPARYDQPTGVLVKCRPDAASLHSIPGQAVKLAFLWEIDNGTETHAQVLSKLPGYHALLTTQRYRRPWAEHLEGAPLVARVLFVFPSADRLENILDRLRAAPTLLWRRPRDYRPTEEDRARALAFLDQHVRCAVLDELETLDLFTRPLWRTPSRSRDGERLAIYRRASA